MSQNVTTLSRYNSDIRESILIIFGINITEKVDNQNVLYFPTSRLHYLVNSKPGNCAFLLKCCMFLTTNIRNTLKNITWSQLNHPSLSKRSTVCTRQDLGREHSILQYVTLKLDVYQVCHYVGRCVKNGSCSYQA